MPDSYPVNSVIRDDLVNRFSYHQPMADQAPRYNQVRQGFRDLALRLAELCPQSRELSVAFTLMQQANMMANAAIACNEKPVAAPTPAA